MPLDAAQKRAIARVSVPVDNRFSRGTGFLVADGGLVLTAFHVIGDHERRKPYPGTITLAFGDPDDGKQVTTTATLIPDRSSAVEDWALLRCDQSLPGIAPFELAPLEDGYDLLWETYGFSDAAPDKGQVYGGKVRSLGKKIQLFSDEAASGQSSRVKGLSGSPCLVYGRAVGLILRANIKAEAHGVKAASEGTLYARSIAEIAARCNELKLRAEEPPLTPFVAHYLQPAAKQLLPVLADALHISTGALPPDHLVREAAQQLIELGVREACGTLAKLVAAIERRDALRILELIAACSVHRDAASRLRQALSTKGPEQAACVNATRPVTGERYIVRAGEAYPGWKQYLRTVPNIGPEGQPAALIAQVEEVLADALKCPREELDGELDALGYDDPPLVVVVPPPLPAPAVAAALRARYPTVRFVFLAGDDVAASFPAEYPTVVLVEPRLVAEHEREQERAFSSAQRKIDAAYRALEG